MHVDSTEFVVAEGKYSLSVSQKVLNFCCDNCGFFLGGGGSAGRGSFFERVPFSTLHNRAVFSSHQLKQQHRRQYSGNS